MSHWYIWLWYFIKQILLNIWVLNNMEMNWTNSPLGTFPLTNVIKSFTIWKRSPKEILVQRLVLAWLGFCKIDHFHGNGHVPCIFVCKRQKIQTKQVLCKCLAINYSLTLLPWAAEEYRSSVVSVLNSLCLVHTATTSGQYSSCLVRG